MSWIDSFVGWHLVAPFKVMLITSYIKGSAYYVPEGKLTHEELVNRFGSEQAEKIAESSGIYERRVVKNNECASDLAKKAAEELFEALELNPKEIETLLFATQTPDYLLPTTACILQDKLGLPKTAAVFDINLGCSQYVYALMTGHSMIVSGVVNNALILTGDTVSRIINPMDRSVVPLFGDAGTATLLKKSKDNSGFLGFDFGSDGSGYKNLIWPTSGLRKIRDKDSAIESIDKSGSVRREDDMFMDGAAVFLFTIKTIPMLVNRLLEKSHLSIKDIDLFIFHQGSELIIRTAAKTLKIPREKLHFKLHDIGNSGGSTVAITLTDALIEGKVKPGMKILLAAFGVGLSWSGAIIRWSNQAKGGICSADYSSSPPKPKNQL